MDWREERRAELLQLRRADPAMLLALYRRALALDEFAPLPDDISEEKIIETVIRYESMMRPRGGQRG